MEFTKIEPKKKQSAQTESAQNPSIIPWQPFPIDQFPSAMRDMVTGVQNTIGLNDGSTPAIATLATVAGTIGSSCKIKIKEGYYQPVHLYTAIIARSGNAKSGTIESLIDPLQEKQSEWFENWESDKEQFDINMREWKSAKKGERPELPIEPAPPKRIIISDITIEAVGQRLKENPLGLLLYVDELDGFFGNMGRYNKGDDLSHWLSIHNGKPLVIDRKGGDYIRIAHPAVAVIGGIQPAILKERLKANPDYFHSGFFARFLIAMPPVEPILLNNNVLSQEIAWQWNWLLKSILEQRELALAGAPCEGNGGKVSPHVFPLEPAAWDTMKKYQHRHAIKATSVNDSESALEGKFATNTARIALILHVVKQIESGTTLSECKPIPAETMESACKIVEWFTNESKRIYPILSATIESTDRETIAVWEKIKSLGGECTVRELRRTMSRYDKEGGTELLTEELLKLVKLGKLSRTHRPAGNGQEQEIFFIPK